MSPQSRSQIEQARGWLAAAERTAILTGAGISAESGVPTFRGPGGLWRNQKPERLATPEAFAADPTLVWEWYDWRRQRLAEARVQGPLEAGDRARFDLDHLPGAREALFELLAGAGLGHGLRRDGTAPAAPPNRRRRYATPLK